MSAVTIRPYQGHDEPALLQLWNLAYYDALGTVRGCLGGFRKAVALMSPGAWVRRVAYLPGMDGGDGKTKNR